VRTALLLSIVLALTACGSHSARSPEQVARAWSAALNRDDSAAAAALFAPGAQVVQDQTLELPGKSAATKWNSELPCGGRIESVTAQGANEVLVVFALTERPGHTCDGPGDQAAAVFRVQHGRIVLWHQVPPPAPDVI
jgi:limonene-1,2-epoxide hydrolase